MDRSQVPAHFGFAFTEHVHHSADPGIDPTKVTLPKGYTVVITGAGRGIGEYIARAFASAGASNIIITARTASDLDRVKQKLESINPKARVITAPGDATHAESYAQLRSLIIGDLDGSIDTIVCNAGPGPAKGGRGKSMDDIEPDEFLESTKINYIGPFYAAKYLMGLLRNGKTIINITSAASHWTTAGTSPIYYCIAKHAQNRLSQWIGETWAEEGINCISLHPGGVQTPGMASLSQEFQEVFQNSMIKRCPWFCCYSILLTSVAVLIDDIDLCGAVCVWLSKEARPWASGRFLSSRWDMHELERRQDEIVKNDLLKFRMAV